MTSDLIRQLSDIDAGMIDDVGGKAANLGALISAGFPVPQGFCVTTGAYQRIADATAADDLPANQSAERIRSTPIPDDVAAVIIDSYRQLGEQVPVAVRSSATAEDLPFASFAGQQDTYLGVIGAAGGARCGPPLLGVAVDRARRRLPRHPGHRSPRRSGWRSSCRRWSTPRSPGCCSPRTRSPGGAARR